MTENAQRNREAEVNLLAAAREAQWSAAAFMGPNTMKLVSPAKVNLLLAIGARREDGYHDADTIMHALALHDTLYLCAEDISADELAKRTAEGASREDVAVGGPADNLVMTIDLADRTGQDLAVPAATTSPSKLLIACPGRWAAIFRGHPAAHRKAHPGPGRLGRRLVERGGGARGPREGVGPCGR
ncbi:MAG: hypothetical protein ACLUVF_01140 [Adlercreutzia sp.]